MGKNEGIILQSPHRSGCSWSNSWTIIICQNIYHGPLMLELGMRAIVGQYLRGHTVNIVNLARHFLDYFIFKNRKSMPTIDIYLLLFKQAYTVLPAESAPSWR